MNKIIQRYLAANFIMPFLVSTVFFASFLLTFQLFRLTQLIISKGMSTMETLSLFGYIWMNFLPLAIPLSALFATIYTFNKLSNDSEYVAIRSFGFNKNQIYTPFLIVSVFISFMALSLNQNLIPHSKREYTKIVEKIQSSSIMNDIKSSQFFTSIPGVTLLAEEVSNEGKNLKNIFLRFRSGGGIEKVIFSAQGEFIQEIDQETNLETIRLLLKNGNIVNKYQDGKLEKILFEVYNFPIGDNSLSNVIATKANMMTGDQLKNYLSKNKNKIKKNDPGFDEYIRIKLEYWTRFNTSVECLIFILLGFVLGVKDVRSEKSGKSGKNALVILGYYVFFFFLISQARKGRVPVEVAAFLPSILLGFYSYKQFTKLDWTS